MSLPRSLLSEIISSYVVLENKNEQVNRDYSALHQKMFFLNQNQDYWIWISSCTYFHLGRNKREKIKRFHQYERVEDLSVFSYRTWNISVSPFSSYFDLIELESSKNKYIYILSLWYTIMENKIKLFTNNASKCKAVCEELIEWCPTFNIVLAFTVLVDLEHNISCFWMC